MAPSPPHALIAMVTVIFIFSLPYTSVVGCVECNASNRVVGSRPPGCENRCFKCRPCMAALVSPTEKHDKGFEFSFRAGLVSREEDGTYYLLSWKCKCGDEFFEP